MSNTWNRTPWSFSFDRLHGRMSWDQGKEQINANSTNSIAVIFVRYLGVARVEPEESVCSQTGNTVSLLRRGWGTQRCETFGKRLFPTNVATCLARRICNSGTFVVFIDYTTLCNNKPRILTAWSILLRTSEWCNIIPIGVPIGMKFCKQRKNSHTNDGAQDATWDC